MYEILETYKPHEPSDHIIPACSLYYYVYSLSKVCKVSIIIFLFIAYNKYFLYVVRSQSFRIIGGTEVIPHEYPWMAALFYGQVRTEDFKCGGTIIASRWVLSAAHCFEVIIIIVINN